MLRALVIGMMAIAMAAEPETTTDIWIPPSVSTMAEMLQEEHTDYTDEERDLLARLVFCEANTQDLFGKEMIVAVVLNRVESEKFPSTIDGVVYQKNAFTPATNGKVRRITPTDECYLAVDNVLNGEFDMADAKGALFFESGGSWHSNHLNYLFKHGGHRFYK